MIVDIIRDLRRCFSTDPGFCDCDKCHFKKGCIDELGIAAADALEKMVNFYDTYCERCNNKTWIPVEKSLPEKAGHYLVVTNGYRKEVQEAVFGEYKDFFGNEGYFWRDPVEEYSEYDVTHWMPMPEPPEVPDES